MSVPNGGCWYLFDLGPISNEPISALECNGMHQWGLVGGPMDRAERIPSWACIVRCIFIGPAVVNDTKSFVFIYLYITMYMYILSVSIL